MLRLVALVLGALVSGCSQRTANDAAVPDQRARDLGQTDSGSGIPDIDITPRILLRTGIHLHTALPPDMTLAPLMTSVWVDKKVVEAELKAGLYLRKRDTTAVPFDVSVVAIGGKLSVTVKPQQPLPVDTDYVFGVMPSKILMPTNPALFRVGSLPRVASIRTYFDGKDLHISVGLSEPVDPQKLSQKLSITDSARKPVSIAGLGSLGYKLDASYLNAPLRLRIETDVGALGGGKLDGDYSGNMAGTPFELTFVASDHLTKEGKAAWEPTINF